MTNSESVENPDDTISGGMNGEESGGDLPVMEDSTVVETGGGDESYASQFPLQHQPGGGGDIMDNISSDLNMSTYGQSGGDSCTAGHNKTGGGLKKKKKKSSKKIKRKSTKSKKVKRKTSKSKKVKRKSVKRKKVKRKMGKK